MNLQGGPAGQATANNQNEVIPDQSLESNNQNEVIPHQSLESLQRPLQTNGPSTGVPLHESPNVALESNISPSSSLAGTPLIMFLNVPSGSNAPPPYKGNEGNNPSNDLDLSLSLGLGSGHEGGIGSPTMSPSNNIVAPRYAVQEQGMQVHGATSSNTVILPTKRNSSHLSSREFHVGESSNSEQPAQAKRSVTDSHVSANNNVMMNPSPPLPHQMQLFSETARTEQTFQGYHHHHVNPHNGAAPTPPLPLPHFSTSLMSSSLSSTNIVNERHAPHAILPLFSQIRGDVMTPFHGQRTFHGTAMFAPQLGTSNLPANLHFNPRSHINGNGIFVGQTQSFNLPQGFDPEGPLQLLSGFVGDGGRIHHGQAIMHNPLNEQAGPSASGLSQSSRGMTLSAVAISSEIQNYSNGMMPIPTLHPRFHFGPPFLQPLFPTVESSRRLSYEELMRGLGFSNALDANEAAMFTIYSGPRARLSGEAILNHIKRDTFVSVEKENPEDVERCSICLEEYEDGEEIGKLDLCVHKYHVECIKQWLMQRNECPVCRRIALTVNNVRNE